jgi:hypothetical protein
LRTFSAAAGVVCILAARLCLAQEANLQIAEYAEQGELLFPPNTAIWVHLGSSLGGDYSTDEFDPENPGVLGVVQMEPAAFQYFQEHSEYADGTMLLLSFYAASSASDPELKGFVQGNLIQQEIHVIDRTRYDEEGRAFFVFPPASDRARAVPTGSECFACHTEHGAYDGTFTQFYPMLREQIAENSDD